MARPDWNNVVDYAKQATLVILTDDEAKTIAGSTQQKKITFENLEPILDLVGYKIYRDTTDRIVIHKG